MKALIFTLLCLPTLVFAQNQCPSGYQCTLIIDAGSSGSRAKLYQFKLNSAGQPIEIKLIGKNKVSPGLSELKPSADKVDAYFRQLMAPFADVQDGLKVKIYATAGMRLTTPNQQQAVYQQIESWFKQTPSSFKLDDVRTISGKEEGLYGWLAVNYLNGTFNSAKPIKALAVMDFGGASVQISFPVLQASPSQHEDINELDINGRHYRVYSHSFLGLGLNQSLNQYINQSQCYTEGYPLPDGEKGKGQQAGCVNHLKALINQVHEVKNKVSPLLKTQGQQQWVVMGSLPYLSNDAHLLLGDSFSLKILTDKSNQSFCQVKWSYLKSTAPNNPYLYSDCFNSAYFHTLMHYGYGLKNSTMLQTKIKSRQGQQDKLDLDWSLGVIVANGQIH